MFLFQLSRIEHRDRLVRLDQISLIDRELFDAPRDLRAHDDVVGGDDACKDERNRPRTELPVVGASGNEDQQNQRSNQSFHVESNNCIKHLFDSAMARLASPIHLWGKPSWLATARKP